MHYSKEEKAMWLEDWQQSGMGAWAYAKENGIIPQTFAGWAKRETKGKSGFVEIKPKVTLSSQQRSAIIIEKGDIKINIPLEASGEELGIIIKALKEAL